MQVFKFFLVVLLFFIMATFIKVIDNKSGNNKHRNSTTTYYFWDGTMYQRAESQKFMISFTGEVLNAYFMFNGKEYSTKQYYKEIK